MERFSRGTPPQAPRRIAGIRALLPNATGHRSLMRKTLRFVPFLVALVACASLQVRERPICFLALSNSGSDTARSTPEPRLLRLTSVNSDTSGVAQVDLFAGSTIAGRWRRISADSISVDAAGPFDAVRLRLNTSRDTTIGTVELCTDADLLRPQVPVRPWAAARGACPRQ